MAQKILHEKTLNKMTEICEWFQAKTSELAYPIYSSYDIRDGGYKIANVDANIYPAGFNNICPMDKETSAQLMKDYIQNHYGNIERLVLVTEEHTSNPYYWENAAAIMNLIEEAGVEVRLAFARPLEAPLHLKSASGIEVEVGSAMADSELMKTFKPQLIISNNDFSDAHEDWAKDMTLPVNPPRELGWYQRKKSRYFKYYNQLVSEFSKIADVDQFLLNVETEEFLNFEIENPESRMQLSQKVDQMIERLSVEYKKRGIQEKPFVFVKNNAGTYGLAVIKVNSGKEVEEWSYKSRKKMKAAKGGRDVEELIIQEGIPSIVKSDDASAEPVIYMIGCQLAGGFLRTHSEKSATESLNSPGAVYKRLCVSDLALDPKGCPSENVYGWSAKLGLLAIALEAKEMGVSFKNYKNTSCRLT